MTRTLTGCALQASIALLALGCDRSAANDPPAASQVDEPVEPAKPRATGAGPMPDDWVQARVAESEARLSASPAGRLVWAAVQAHGGLSAFLRVGTIEFEFDYRPVAQPARRMYTFNKVDLWRARAHQQELGESADAELGWNGEQAWIVPGPDAFPTPARFWATTPYYFVAIPWVLADPGTSFEQLADATFREQTYDVVKVTYEAGTGDSPDDYYVLYIHPETHRVDAIRYIVSYPGFFPEGEHSPEKLMAYLDQREVQGLHFAHRYETFEYDVETGDVGDKVTDVDISRIRLGQEYPADLFAPRQGAVTTESITRPN